MAFVFLNTDQIYTGSYYPIANGDTVHVTTGTIIANAESYTVRMAGGVYRTFLANYGDIIGHANSVIYMGAGSSVVENHGLIRNNDDSSTLRSALLIAAAGSHRIVNHGEITSAGRVVNVEGAAGALSFVVQNHGLMQALYGNELLYDGTFIANVTVENSGSMRGGEVAMSGTGWAYLDNSGTMEVTQIDGAAILGLTLYNTGAIEGFENVTVFGADLGEGWIQGSAAGDRIHNLGRIRADLDASDGDDVIYNMGQWSGDLALGYGDDTFYGYGGRVDGSVDAGPGDDVLYIDDASVAIDGGTGIDVLIARADVLNVTNVEAVLLVGAGNHEVLGSDAAEQIYGNSGANRLSGLAGADTIFGGAGDDEIFGDDDNDFLLGNSGADEISGGLGADTLRGGGGADVLSGGEDNDWMAGDDGHDLLDGGTGNDTLIGSFGQDSLQGGEGADWLYGQSEADYLDGGAGGDRVLGGSGNDTLYGGAGNDTISGDAGDDVLYAGLGADYLLGRAGADRFVFESVAEIQDSTPDRITDFEPGVDLIDVATIDDEDSFHFIGTSAFSGSGDMELRYFLNAFGATYLQFDADGNGVADASMILINVPGGVTASDFLL